jgi:choline dehydrogenase-like flavoprotein
MRKERYDVIVIGTGAGGGTMAYALAGTSARVLILERGDFVPQEDENWNPEAVWKDRRYRPKTAVAPRVPPVHALRRRRQHEILGQRALPSAS